MTDNRLSVRAGAVRRCAGMVLLAGLLLAGCSRNSEYPAGSRLRVYAADLTGGARVCDAPLVKPIAGGSSEVSIKVANDGGWCGILLRRESGKPFDAGLLTSRATHGSVTIHEVGDDTRIDYTPDHGFSGTDAFAVKLIPGGSALRVAVTVTAPGT